MCLQEIVSASPSTHSLDRADGLSHHDGDIPTTIEEEDPNTAEVMQLVGSPVESHNLGLKEGSVPEGLHIEALRNGLHEYLMQDSMDASDLQMEPDSFDHEPNFE